MEKKKFSFKSKNRRNSAIKCLKEHVFCAFYVFKKRKCAGNLNYYTTGCPLNNGPKLAVRQPSNSQKVTCL